MKNLPQRARPPSKAAVGKCRQKRDVLDREYADPTDGAHNIQLKLSLTDLARDLFFFCLIETDPPLACEGIPNRLLAGPVPRHGWGGNQDGHIAFQQIGFSLHLS